MESLHGLIDEIQRQHSPELHSFAVNEVNLTGYTAERGRMGAGAVQGGPLIMCVDKDGWSCLLVAAQNGHTAVVEVGAGGGKQREAGGRVPAATAHGTWCRGCRQHTATRGTTLQHTAARCCSVRTS